MNDFGQSIGYARKCKNIKRRFCHKWGTKQKRSRRALLLREQSQYAKLDFHLGRGHVTNLTIWRFYSKTSFRFIRPTLKNVYFIIKCSLSPLEAGKIFGLRGRHCDYRLYVIYLFRFKKVFAHSSHQPKIFWASRSDTRFDNKCGQPISLLLLECYGFQPVLLNRFSTHRW